MSFDGLNYFTKANLDTYLKELAKEYRRRNGKSVPAEIILIGGAAILTNYGFRNMTMDVDAIIHASSTMKDVVNYIGDKFGLPTGWLNTDFTRTVSYSPKLNQYSVYYKTFSNILTVRTITAEYLIAMKLCSGRKYKNDLSDILGILAEHEKQGNPITLKQIDTAVQNLYGSWECIPDDSQIYIKNVLQNGNYEHFYHQVSEEEQLAKNILIDFELQYPRTLNTDNINNILKNLKARRNTSLRTHKPFDGNNNQQM